MWLITLDGDSAVLEPRPALLEHVLDLHPVHPVDGAGILPAEVVLAGEERGHAGGIVLVHDHFDLVDVGLPGDEVAGVPDEGEAHVRAVAVEHPRTGADHRLRLLEVAELLHRLLGHDAGRHRVGQHVEEPDEGLLQGEAHGVLVERLHLVHRGQHVGVGIALDGAEALHRVDDVVRGELAPVHRGLVVPPHAAAQLEHVGGLVGLAPRLGEVALDREGPGLRRRGRPCA